MSSFLKSADRRHRTADSRQKSADSDFLCADSRQKSAHRTTKTAYREPFQTDPPSKKPSGTRPEGYTLSLEL